MPVPDTGSHTGVELCAGLEDWFVAQDRPQPRTGGGLGGSCGEVSPEDTLTAHWQATLPTWLLPVMAGYLAVVAIDEDVNAPVLAPAH